MNFGISICLAFIFTIGGVNSVLAQTRFSKTSVCRRDLTMPLRVQFGTFSYNILNLKLPIRDAKGDVSLSI